MARGLMIVLAMVVAQTAGALSEVEKCARKADHLVSKEYPGRHISREEFKNTTPGSYYQEYVGTYLIDGQQVIAEFYSPFICDNLQLVSTRQ